jgi:RNA polymerase sigma-70 factor (ECF subfamily)
MSKISSLSEKLTLLKSPDSASSECQFISKEQPVHQERCQVTDEERLIRSTQQGDLEAFNRLVLAFQDQLYNQAYRLLDDAMAADDAVQEAFLSAYRAFPTYRGGSFRAWLSRIVTNKCLDELRYRKCRPTRRFVPQNEWGEENESPTWAIDPRETPEERLLNGEFVDVFQDALNRLSPGQHTVLVLVDVMGMSYKEAARNIGWPMGTVKSSLARARVQMQRCLRAYLSMTS